VKHDIRSQTLEQLEAQLQAWVEPRYRAAQVTQWLYERKAVSWDSMSNLPKALRERLASEYSLQTLALVRKQGAADSTQKFLWQLGDGALIESVLIPANPALYGEPSDRHTLCVSTQVGCAYGCRFCASGLEGWKRNLQAHEIVEQLLAVERWHATGSGRQRTEGGGEGSEVRGPNSEDGAENTDHGSRITNHATRTTDHAPRTTGNTRLINNLVIMGMGEPLANYTNLIQALRILNAPWGGKIGARKITVSTSGLAPQIRKLADEPFQFRLAISLHGATDAVRSKIMPVNRKYPLSELTAACEYYVAQKGKMITLEYILIAGVNDSPTQANPLADLARRLNAKVNLIPYNKVEGLRWERPIEQVQEAFLAAVERNGVSATLRREKGHDIDAACGQLRLKTERELRLVQKS
jgi:23S rRNA (adenine2503-C2)-methyltransferase